MIFKPKHIEMIREGTKTQTRRLSDRYKVGKDYAVQPGRGKKGISDLRIKIKRKWKEHYLINKNDAKAEGGYDPTEYENLFQDLFQNWSDRWAYEFEVLKYEKG